MSELMHETAPEWTFTDAELAELEGWNIFDLDGTGILEIERVDCPDVEGVVTLGGDDDALRNVREKAAAGSPLHIKALAIHERFAAQRAGLRDATPDT